jgi:hypothetical protein
MSRPEAIQQRRMQQRRTQQRRIKQSSRQWRGEDAKAASAHGGKCAMKNDHATEPKRFKKQAKKKSNKQPKKNVRGDDLLINDVVVDEESIERSG